MIEIKDLYQWIQPNTCDEIIGMNPTALEDAYVSAIGYLAGEIGNIYDLEEMLPVMKDVHPDLFFMVRVLTASAFMGSTFHEPVQQCDVYYTQDEVWDIPHDWGG